MEVQEDVCGTPGARAVSRFSEQLGDNLLQIVRRRLQLGDEAKGADHESVPNLGGEEETQGLPVPLVDSFGRIGDGLLPREVAFARAYPEAEVLASAAALHTAKGRINTLEVF